MLLLSWHMNVVCFDFTYELHMYNVTCTHGLFREKLRSWYLRSQWWLCLVEEAVVKLKLSLVYVRWLSRKYTSKRRKNMMIMSGSLYTKLWESMRNTDFIHCMENTTPTQCQSPPPSSLPPLRVFCESVWNFYYYFCPIFTPIANN